jgi:hypothetical protein
VAHRPRPRFHISGGQSQKKFLPLLGARSFLSVLTTKSGKSGVKVVRTDKEVNEMVKSDTKMDNQGR